MIFCGQSLWVIQDTTFDGNDQLGKYSQDFIWIALHQLLSALNGEEFIRLLGLPQTLKENGQVKMVIQVLGLQLPSELSSGTLETHGNRKIPSVVVFSKQSGLSEQFSA